MSTTTAGRATTSGAAASGLVRDATRLVALVAFGLAAGAALATWVADVAMSSSSAEAYISYRQATTAAFTATLPPLGGIGLLAAAVSAVRGRGRERALAAAAVLCAVAAMAVTVIVHFPINAEILAWSPTAPPADWPQVRDRWSAAHTARTLLALAGFGLLAIDRWRERSPRP